MSKRGQESEGSSTEAVSSMVGGNQPNDIGPTLPITCHRLNGQNYMQWAQSVMMYVSGKGREDYLTGEIVVPKKEDPGYKVWRAENNMVMSWLINTMENEIGQNFLFYKTASEVWEAAKETYSDSRNTAEILEIKGALHDLRQGDLTVSQYYNTLTRFWQQLDMFEELEWDCPGDSIKYRRVVEKERVLKFLLGLNKNLDEVRGRIFGMKPLPSLREVFSEIRREESRRKVMMGLHEASHSAESSALASYVNPGAPQGAAKDRRGRPGGRPWCDHCKKPGHTKDTCWKLHGKPQDARPAKEKGGRGLTAGVSEEMSTSEAVPFTKEQLEALQKMLQQMQPMPQTVATSSITQKGKILHALGAVLPERGVWIVDSGATDHMTGDVTLLHDFTPCTEALTVKVADGTNSPVKGRGTAHLTPTLTLHSVLFIPNLSYNLLSVSKLTKELTCVVKF